MNSEVLVSEKELEFIRKFQEEIGKKVSVHAGMTRCAQRIANYLFNKSQRSEVRNIDKRRALFGFASYYNEYIFKTQTPNYDVDDIMTALSKKRDFAAIFDNYIDSIGVTLIYLVSGEVVAILLVARISSSEISTSIIRHVKEIAPENITVLNPSLLITHINDIRKMVNVPSVVLDMELQTASYSLISADKRTLDKKMKEIGSYTKIVLDNTTKSAYETFVSCFTKPEFNEMILAPACSMAFGIDHQSQGKIQILILAREEAKKFLNMQTVNEFSLNSVSTPQSKDIKNRIFSPIHTIDIPSTPVSSHKIETMKAAEITPRSAFVDSQIYNNNQITPQRPKRSFYNPMMSPMNVISNKNQSYYNPNDHQLKSQSYNYLSSDGSKNIIDIPSENTKVKLHISPQVYYHSPSSQINSSIKPQYHDQETQAELFNLSLKNPEQKGEIETQAKPKYFVPSTISTNYVEDQTPKTNVLNTIPQPLKNQEPSESKPNNIFRPMDSQQSAKSMKSIKIFNPNNTVEQKYEEKNIDEIPISNVKSNNSIEELKKSTDQKHDDINENKVQFNIPEQESHNVYTDDQIISIAEGEISFYIIEELNKIRNAHNHHLLLVDAYIQNKQGQFLQDFVHKRAKFDQQNPFFVEVRQKYKKYWVKTYSGSDFHVAPQNFLDSFFANAELSYKLFTELNRISVSVNIQKNGTYNIICILAYE